jgi:thiosulfate dehydrogenase [quinone] large subunit
MKITAAQLGTLGLRLALGVNMLIHGWMRVGSGFDKFQAGLLKTFSESSLPPFLVEAAAHTIPYVELLLGFTLLLGLKTKWVAFFGALFMCTLIFGMGVLQNWEVVGSQMIYVICFYLLLQSPELDFGGIDVLFKSNPKTIRPN